jgi:hypothetical protein
MRKYAYTRIGDGGIRTLILDLANLLELLDIEDADADSVKTELEKFKQTYIRNVSNENGGE